MRIADDPVKRAKTFAERGLDFEGVATVFAGTTFETSATSGAAW